MSTSSTTHSGERFGSCFKDPLNLIQELRDNAKDLSKVVWPMPLDELHEIAKWPSSLLSAIEESDLEDSLNLVGNALKRQTESIQNIWSLCQPALEATLKAQEEEDWETARLLCQIIQICGLLFSNRDLIIYAYEGLAEQERRHSKTEAALFHIRRAANILDAQGKYQKSHELLASAALLLLTVDRYEECMDMMKLRMDGAISRDITSEQLYLALAGADLARRYGDKSREIEFRQRSETLRDRVNAEMPDWFSQFPKIYEALERAASKEEVKELVNKNQSMLSKDFVTTLADCWVYNHYFDESMRIEEFCVAASIATKDLTILYAAVEARAKLNAERGDFDFAARLYDEAADFLQTKEDWTILSDYRLQSGYMLLNLCRYDESCQRFDEAISAAKKISDLDKQNSFVVMATLGKGRVLGEKRCFMEALHCFKSVWKNSDKKGDRISIALEAADEASKVCERMKEHARAVSWQKRRLELACDSGVPRSRRAGYLIDVAISEVRKCGNQNPERPRKNISSLNHAMHLLKQADEISNQIGDLQMRSHALTNCAVVKQIKGHHSEALKMHNRVLEINQDTACTKGMAESYGNIAFNLEELGMQQQAVAKRLHAMAWYWRAGALDRVSGTAQEMAFRRLLSGVGEKTVPVLTLAYGLEAWRNNHEEMANIASSMINCCRCEDEIKPCREVLAHVIEFVSDGEKKTGMQLNYLQKICSVGPLLEAKSELARWKEADLSEVEKAEVYEAAANLAAREENDEQELIELKHAVKILETYKVDKSSLNLLMRIGRFHEKRNRFRDAEAIYQRVWNSKPGGTLSHADAAYRLGILCHDTGRHQESLVYHKANLQYLKEMSVTSLKLLRAAHYETGLAELTLGHTDEAKTHFEKALQLAVELDDKIDEGRSLIHIAQCLEMRDEHGEAINNVRRALNISRKIKDTTIESISLYLLAAYMQDRGKSEEALKLAEEGLKLDRRIDRNYGVATKLQVCGLIHLKAKRHLNAFKAFKESARLLEKLHIDAKTNISYYGMGTILAERGKLDAAISILERALKNIVGELPMPIGRRDPVSQFNKTPDLVALLLRLKLLVGRSEAEIHRTVQFARGRYMSRLLGMHAAVTSERTPRDLVNRELEFSQTRSRYEAQISNAESFDELQISVRDVEQIRKKHNELLKEINQYDPVYVAVRRGEPFERKEVQRFLNNWNVNRDRTTGILEYYVLDKELLLWFIGPDLKYIFERVPISRNNLMDIVNSSISPMRQSPGQRNDNELMHERLRILSMNLLPPRIVEQVNPVSHLCVIPHDILYYVPFQTLWCGSQQVINQKTVSTADNLLAACVALSTSDSNSKCIHRVAAAGVVSNKYTDKKLRTIVEKTVGMVAAISQGDILIGKEVTIDKVIAILEHYDHVHVVCHGELNVEKPMSSGLLVADDEGGKDNILDLGKFPERLRLLTANELRKVQVNADLIFLNACVSAFSMSQPGDELIGLTRSLLAAGANTVIGALWKVHGEAASLVAHSFHKWLGAGKSKAESLAYAQRELASIKKFNDPYYWGPFTLIGTWA